MTHPLLQEAMSDYLMRKGMTAQVPKADPVLQNRAANANAGGRKPKAKLTEEVKQNGGKTSRVSN